MFRDPNHPLSTDETHETVKLCDKNFFVSLSSFANLHMIFMHGLHDDDSLGRVHDSLGNLE